MQPLHLPSLKPEKAVIRPRQTLFVYLNRVKKTFRNSNWSQRYLISGLFFLFFTLFYLFIIFSVWQRWTISKGKINGVHKTRHCFTWGHSPPEWALRLISSTVFFLESWSDRDTNTGLIYLIKAERKQRNTAWLNAGAKALFRRFGKTEQLVLSLTELEQTTVDLGGVFMIYTRCANGWRGPTLCPAVLPLFILPLHFCWYPGFLQMETWFRSNTRKKKKSWAVQLKEQLKVPNFNV